MSDNLDVRYIAARHVLLDALTALRAQGSAVIVVGAQAIYLRTGFGDLGIAPFTTDGDLALDPTLLVDEPHLEQAMLDANFFPNPVSRQPGAWIATVTIAGQPTQIPVDLMVPDAALPPSTRRGARIDPHDRNATRRTPGLEAALRDHSTMTITALEPADVRSLDVEVAGLAALLVAKAHKIQDRVDGARPDRISDKDASDVYRIMQNSRPQSLAATLRGLLDDPVAGNATRVALGYLRTQFADRRSVGVQMAQRALDLAINPDQIAVVATTYTAALLAAILSE